METLVKKSLILSALFGVASPAIAADACDQLQSANVQLQTEDCAFLVELSKIQPSMYQAYVETQLHADNAEPLSVVEFITLVTQSGSAVEETPMADLSTSEEPQVVYWSSR